MRKATQFSMVWVTTPDRRTARRLARAALYGRLAACANLFDGVESHYWWEGKLARGKEVQVVFKTARSAVKALEALVLQLHPYETPEILEIPLWQGTPRYLDWIAENVRPAKLRKLR